MTNWIQHSWQAFDTHDSDSNIDLGLGLNLWLKFYVLASLRLIFEISPGQVLNKNSSATKR